MCHYESWQRHCTKVAELLSKYRSASMRCAVLSIVIGLALVPHARPYSPGTGRLPFGPASVTQRPGSLLNLQMAYIPAGFGRGPYRRIGRAISERPEKACLSDGSPLRALRA